MNIIKLKDKIMTPEESGLEQELCDEFNETLKGRYAWWVQCIYIVPFDDMTAQEYIDVEENGWGSVEPWLEYFSNYEISDFVDIDTTDRINSISKYVFFNGYAPDDDITVDMLRRFRTWLAEELLLFDDFLLEYFGDDKPQVVSMLNYYAHEMDDEVIEILGKFVNASVVYTTFPSVGTCGCGTNGTNAGIPVSVVKTDPNMSGLTPVTLGKDCGCQQGFTIGGNASISNCDPVAIYRNAIYNYMVKVFSDTNFWMSLSKYDPSGEKNPVELFKKYVDGIIQQNFPLTTSRPMQFDDCQCLNNDNKEQQRAMDMLRELSTALGYIIENAGNETYEYIAGDLVVTTSLTGHKNFVAVALNNWATYLYEIMRW